MAEILTPLAPWHEFSRSTYPPGLTGRKRWWVPVGTHHSLINAVLHNSKMAENSSGLVGFFYTNRKPRVSFIFRDFFRFFGAPVWPQIAIKKTQLWWVPEIYLGQLAAMSGGYLLIFALVTLVVKTVKLHIFTPNDHILTNIGSIMGCWGKNNLNVMSKLNYIFFVPVTAVLSSKIISTL